MVSQSPTSEQALLEGARALSGASVARLASQHGLSVPGSRRDAKGFVGLLLERSLGADAGNLPAPDFQHLGIELKTVPVSIEGTPRESTYVCVAPRAGQPWGRFTESLLFRKLAAVLFVPIISSPDHTLGESVIGDARLWRPDEHARAQLANDWQVLAERALSGAPPDGRVGAVVQLRPKAAHGRDLRPGVDADGVPTRCVPMGFYLRAQFTSQLLKGAPTQ